MICSRNRREMRAKRARGSRKHSHPVSVPMGGGGAGTGRRSAPLAPPWQSCVLVAHFGEKKAIRVVKEHRRWAAGFISQLVREQRPGAHGRGAEGGVELYERRHP